MSVDKIRHSHTYCARCAEAERDEWKARAERAEGEIKRLFNYWKARTDQVEALLAKVEALCDSHGPSPHHAACHRCASLIRDVLDSGSDAP